MEENLDSESWNIERIAKALADKNYEEMYVRSVISRDFIGWAKIEEKDIKHLVRPQNYYRWVLKDSEGKFIFVGNVWEACKHAKLFSFNIYGT